MIPSASSRRETDCLRQRIDAAYADGLDADERAALDAHWRLQRRMTLRERNVKGSSASQRATRGPTAGA